MRGVGKEQLGAIVAVYHVVDFASEASVVVVVPVRCGERSGSGDDIDEEIEFEEVGARLANGYVAGGEGGGGVGGTGGMTAGETGARFWAGYAYFPAGVEATMRTVGVVLDGNTIVRSGGFDSGCETIVDGGACFVTVHARETLVARWSQSRGA